MRRFRMDICQENPVNLVQCAGSNVFIQASGYHTRSSVYKQNTVCYHFSAVYAKSRFSPQQSGFKNTSSVAELVTNIFFNVILMIVAVKIVETYDHAIMRLQCVRAINKRILPCISNKTYFCKVVEYLLSTFSLYSMLCKNPIVIRSSSNIRRFVGEYVSIKTATSQYPACRNPALFA